MNEKPLTHPHDKFFKDAFSRTKVVSSFVTEYMPTEDRTYVNQSTLEAVKDSHINPELQEFFSDAVYTAVAPDGTTQVYLLFEHKSYYDPYVGAQILENIAMVLQYHRKQHGRTGKMPIIFAVIIYQSASGRNSDDQPIHSFRPFEIHGDILPNLNIRFLFLRLQLYPDKMIRGIPYLKILFLTLKYSHSSRLIEKLPDIIVIFKELNNDPDASEYFEVFLKYLEAVVSEDKYLRLQERIKEVLNMKPDNMSRLLKDVMADMVNAKLKEIREESISKGKEEGIQEGREEGIQEGKKEGIQEGKKEGIQEGKKEGIQEGKKEGIQEGKKEGIQEGKKEGKLEYMRETVLRMISMGMDNEIIGKVSGLNIKEIQEMRKTT